MVNNKNIFSCHEEAAQPLFERFHIFQPICPALFTVGVSAWRRSKCRHFEVFVVSPHLPTRCVCMGSGAGRKPGGGGCSGGCQYSLTSCDNEQHPFSDERDSEGDCIVKHDRLC